MGDIVKVEIEKNRFVLKSKVPKNPKFVQNGFWSKIENTRTIKILKLMDQNVWNMFLKLFLTL